MARLDSWLSADVMHALGWALIHSLWQCLGLAALAAVLIAFSRRPPLRYLVAVAALALMLAAPVATFFVLMKPAAPVHALLPAISGSRVSAAPVNSPGAMSMTLGAPSTAVGNGAAIALGDSPKRFFPSHFLSPDFLPPNILPWLVGAWLCGVALFGLRLAGGFLLLEHRHRSQSATPSPCILAVCQELQRQLGLTHAIRYLECSWLQAPAVIGWIRPIILLPVTAMTGLTEEQLRAVIAHELAHIRRMDAFVNLFQILVETLLFYHPAIWWLNRRIRAERELCCDEIAVSLTGNRLEYARVLTFMAEWEKAPALAMAANRGSLSERIFHVLGQKPAGTGQRMLGLTGSVLFLAAALGAANALFGIAYPIPVAHARESVKAALLSSQTAVDHSVRQVLQASEPAAKDAEPGQASRSPTTGRETAAAGQLETMSDRVEAMASVQAENPVLPLPLLLAASDTPAPAQPAAQSAAQPTPSGAPESITVTATPLPGRSAVDEFIYSYPSAVRTTDKIARWKVGICPVVEGLPPRFADFITRRLAAIAHKAGAPVNADPKCRHNIEIVFTTKPQDLANDLLKNHRPYLGYFDNLNQANELAQVKHDIQAWYLTGTMGFDGAVRVDNPRADFLSTGPYNEGHVFYAAGTGRFNNGISSTLYNVIIVADPSKLEDYEIGSLADYIAMLALSQPKSLDACWEVPSITNLLSKDCEPAHRTASLSDNDATFLYGLYRMSTGDNIFIQRDQIRYFLERNPAPQH